MIGQPLNMDASTFSLSQLILAHFCVEVDISIPLLKRFWVGKESSGKWQYINNEVLPQYCAHCSKLRHSNNEYHVVHHELDDDDDESRKSTKAKYKTKGLTQNPKPKTVQTWQLKIILKCLNVRDSSAARTSSLTNATMQDIVILL
ncbi:hypothetical protein ACH5RR_039351 [Cinchona calisaya]|uniref:Uncharacterized protein n=1 Tax=Cinchona calisaya TaxID=153742 RepID=A0ABD2XZD2_9GENT